MALAIITEEHDFDKGLLEEYVRRSSPPPFLSKTYMLVEDPTTDDIISWNADGTSFVVWKPAEFAGDLLPTLFKHSNFASFVRQLNTYGFRKVTTNRWEFCNDMFRRGSRNLLCKIRRRKAWTNKGSHNTATAPTQIAPQESDEEGGSTSSSSSGYSSIFNENKRLKTENGVLSSELINMKKKCQELLDLVAIFTGSKNDKEEDKRPKLFGVRLEVPMEIRKRKKAEISENYLQI
ncbi:heat stress transcription factor B-3 [Telopea speciosissima]|uniref:heat stress transcription factor B-3 n=1 Tax=Telopea speciosissima TaxID=54955 RepID=UPI001CC6BF6A|nr:heat stress transcription factor B-3 [Telopea speciosissima]